MVTKANVGDEVYVKCKVDTITLYSDRTMYMVHFGKDTSHPCHFDEKYIVPIKEKDQML